jgi:3-deoxy-D-manno-octulosonic-acid transferase
MGELMLFYAAADVAFVGGSLVPVGGHNLLEPAALGVPMLVGPHTFNFAEITEDLVAAHAAERIADAEALGPAILNLLVRHAERRARGENAHAVMERERGAVARSMAIIESICPAPAAADAPAGD